MKVENAQCALRAIPKPTAREDAEDAAL